MLEILDSIYKDVQQLNIISNANNIQRLYNIFLNLNRAAEEEKNRLKQEKENKE